jgi:hypothetical protein
MGTSGAIELAGRAMDSSGPRKVEEGAFSKLHVEAIALLVDLSVFSTIKLDKLPTSA